MKVILIGPMAAGKSTTAELLSKKLDLPHYHNHLRVAQLYRYRYLPLVRRSFRESSSSFLLLDLAGRNLRCLRCLALL